MRILVTGGAGFIGSHLVDRLLQAGHEVICIDNFFTGAKRNLRQWFGHPNFELIRHDIIEPIRLEVEQIYHLACPASPVHYQFDPIQTARIGFLGTYNMLELARQVKARILYTSTSEVYGDPEVHPQREDYWGNVNCTGVRACYDESKRIGETLAYDFQRQYGLAVRVARIFNTYGERMQINDGRVVSNFVVQALEGKPLTVYGDGTQTRSFCYVSDLVEGLIRLMASDFSEPVNLGNPAEYRVLDLAKLIQALVGQTREIVFQPLPKDDPRRRRPDITRAQQVLGWSPTVPVEEGLQRTIAYFRQLLADRVNL
ncbi:MAG: UDP-glucuronic acid decarboxylase family protein [Pseudanabaenaceae cyanobacterium]